MPDFHQPDRADRAEAERELLEGLDPSDVAELRRQAASMGVADADSLDEQHLIRAIRAATPSNRHDPAWPDAPQT